MTNDTAAAHGFSLPYEWAELVEKVQNRNCVLFLGADSQYGFENRLAPPSSSEIAAELAERCGYEKEKLTLPEVAQFYQGRFKRHSLVEVLRTLIEGRPKYRPGRIHELLANLPFSAIITTRYDTLLEEALNRVGKNYEVVVSSDEVPYIGTDKLLVLKLHGCITRPESLVITKRDSFALHRRLEAVLNFVRFLFVTKHLLFVDYNLEDLEFQILFDEVIQTVGVHHRSAFAAWPYYPSDLVTLWPDVSLSVFQAETEPFLKELKANLGISPSVKITIERPSGPLQKPPYKFLDYFTRSDNDIFYGRETETLYCWRRILSHSVVTIFGPSGAGKTSLFLAGIMPQLEKEGYDVISIRAFGDPLGATKQALVRQFASSSNTEKSLLDSFKEIFTEGRKIVVAFDQFEEVFLGTGAETRQQFYQELSQVLHANDLDVRFVFILREDFLALLDEARTLIPSIFTNSYRIVNLSVEQAQVAIIEPAKRVDLRFDPALINQLLDDLDERGISPPQLQIICHQLYQDCLRRNTSIGKANVSGEILSLSDYKILGGARQILGDYLLKVLDNIGSVEGASAKAAAIEVLKIMVSSQRTKLAQTLEEIEINGAVRKVSQDVVNDALDTLVNRRLVRRFEQQGITYFELAHDYLSGHIAQWISEEEWAAKRIREMLAREMSSWREANSLMQEQRFRIINSLRNDLAFLMSDEAELLVRCAFEYGIDYKFWLEKAVEAGSAAWHLIELILENTNPFVRARAVECIGEQPRPQAIKKLCDLLFKEEVRVREVTIEQLGLLNAREVIPDISKLLNDPYPSICWRAADALLKIGSYEAIKALEAYWPKDMILIPAGECVIGSAEEDLEEPIRTSGNQFFKNELPQHTVFIQSFLIDRYLVTNLEYKKFIEATGHTPPPHWLNGEIPENTENHPVSQVSWSDANAYANWAGKRLPTEYEWEKAVTWDPKEHKKLRFPWGDTFEKERCNIGRPLGREPFIPVGTYSPQGDSPYGLVDPIGNGWTWVDGFYNPYPGATFKDPNFGIGLRIQRSCGGWDNEASGIVRPTARSGMPDVSSTEVGFRCAMSIPPYLVSYKEQSEG